MLRHKLELGGPKGFKKHGTQRLDLVIELVRLVNEHSSQPLVGLVFFSSHALVATFHLKSPFSA